MFTMKRGKWLYLILLSFFILMDGYLLIYNTRYRLILSKAVNTNNVSFNSDVNVSHTILTMNDIYENVGLQFRGGLLRDILNHEKNWAAGYNVQTIQISVTLLPSIPLILP